jgi:hypothetical protein
MPATMSCPCNIYLYCNLSKFVEDCPEVFMYVLALVMAEKPWSIRDFLHD